jgi:hypothetical protein
MTMGLKKNKAQVNEMFRLRDEGKSYREIERLTGLSKGTISYHFGEGQKDKTRETTKNERKRRRLIVIEYKESRGCADCKRRGHFYQHPYYVLQADHVWDVKVANVSHMLRNNTLEEIMIELEKCDIVCANCHSIRTHKRRKMINEINTTNDQEDDGFYEEV